MAYAKNTTQGAWNDVLGFLARELHLSKADIDDDDNFSELGLDPILAQNIAPSLSKMLGIKVPAAAFQNYPKVGVFRSYLTEQQQQPPDKQLPENMEIVISKDKNQEKKSPTNTAIHASTKHRASKVPLSIVLQGNPATATQTIFLLPDGSGSAMAYAGLPRISPSACIVGLNSPFLGRAEEYACTIEETAALWLPEIRSRQPRGPYVLGGWSAGGYYAFELSKLLAAQREAVEKIILLDSPCRLNFEALPMEVVRYLSCSGRMGDWGVGPDRTPDWVAAHFEGTLRAVRRYVPSPIQSGWCVPKVFIIWCREGVWSNPQEGQGSGLHLSVKVSRFLLEGKPDFGTHGWEKLFPGTEMLIATMPGNHFTLINQPYVKTLAPLLRSMLAGGEERDGDWQRFKV